MFYKKREKIISASDKEKKRIKRGKAHRNGCQKGQKAREPTVGRQAQGLDMEISHPPSCPIKFANSRSVRGFNTTNKNPLNKRMLKIS